MKKFRCQIEHDAEIIERMLKDHGMEATDKLMIMFDAWMLEEEGEWQSLEDFVAWEELDQFVKHGLLEVGFENGLMCARVTAQAHIEYMVHLVAPDKE